MNNNINLTEILKDCPIGTKLYSPMFGEVDFEKIRSDDEYAIITKRGSYTATFTKEGFYYADADGECTLFPSKEQRDWSKFTAPWLKKERFDPKTLKPFDKVLVKNDDDITWVAALFSHIIEFHDEVTGNDYLESVTSYCTSSFCIPYNDYTKYLVGTTEEAPEFYKYWED